MLLSVLCIVLVIAAVVAAALYFGVIDKDKGVDANLNDLGNHFSHVGNNIKDQFNKLNN